MLVNKRFLGRLIFAAFAVATTIGCLIEFFDNKGEKATAMAVLTLACIAAIKCFED